MDDKTTKSPNIKIPAVRLSFPAVFKKTAFGENEPKYEATFMFNKDKQKDIVEGIKKHIHILMESFKGKKPTVDSICLRDGDESGRAEYQNHYIIKASSKNRPLVIDRDKTPIEEEDGKIYAGCYVNAIIYFWAQNNKYGQRINATLGGIQFYDHGEPFTESLSVDEFDDFDFSGVGKGKNEDDFLDF